MAYAVVFKASALKEIENLPKHISKRIITAVTALADDPRPPRCVKLAGTGNSWRLRLGDYRVVYVIDDAANHVEIRVVAHRREVYRGL